MTAMASFQQTLEAAAIPLSSFALAAMAYVGARRAELRTATATQKAADAAAYERAQRIYEQAMADAEATITGLRKRVASLESEVDSLRSRIASLERGSS